MKVTLLFFLLSIQLAAQSEADACETLSKIKEKIIAFHYKPKPINDSLSAYVYSTLLKNLDDGNDLFLAPEIAVLNSHKLKIDNYINSSNCAFLSDFYTTYLKAVNRKKQIIKEIIAEDFAYSSKEQIVFVKKSRPHLKTENELKKLFKKRILFDVLKDIAESSKNKDSIVANFKAISLQSRNKVFDTYNCQVESYNVLKTDFYEQFYTVFCNYFDPHTIYFSKTDKTNFLSGVSSDNLSFGIDFLINDDNKLIIADLNPGGPAFFSDVLERGDELVKIKTNEDLDINCKNFETVDKILSSNDRKNITFTFRKKNGGIYSVNLVKQLVKDYQNSAYSYILERENHKTGYIKIPSFYATLENGKTNVSDDVKKEVFKLQEDNISGLIIDLENNGGGSMQEAIKLCGLFLNTQYIGQEINNSKSKNIIGNEKYKPFYTGPIVILINGYSASASEFFTNAMQDYNVAVVVGAKSFGKASYQQILPLNDNEDEFVKVTLGKFYSVSGKTNQYSGIKPDIQITNVFDDQIERESKYKTALKNDFVGGVANLKDFPRNEKQKKAISDFTASISTNERYKTNLSFKNKFNKFYDKVIPPINLQFDDVFAQLKKYDSDWTAIDIYNKTVYPFQVFITKYDENSMKLNNNLKLISDKKQKNIKTSYSIFEAINIIRTMK